MKNPILKNLLMLFILFVVSFAAPSGARAQQPVVHAVMFWTAGCAHCEDVIQNVLPPLREKYGEQFDLFMIEVKGASDVDLLFRVADSYGIPKEGTGVPFLIVGEKVLVGSDQVRYYLPDLVADALTRGGLDFPANPLLADILPASAPPLTPELSSQPQADFAPAIEASSDTPVKNNGFALAAAVMVFMAAALLYSVAGFVTGRPYFSASWMDAAVPLLSVVGLGVALYLTYVETQSVEAFCGPVGDCNAVQSSPYSMVWGILPVGLLGAIGYAAILAAWFIARQNWGWVSKYAPLAVFSMALFGAVYSIYLTYLELFVILAVCIWCVSSALIVTLQMLFSLQPALNAFSSEEEDIE